MKLMLGDGSCALHALLSRIDVTRVGYGFQLSPLHNSVRLPSYASLEVVHAQSKQMLDRDIQQFSTHP